MKELTPLAKQIFEITTGWNYEKAFEVEDENMIIKAEGPIAEKIAALCSEKIRRAIELAREAMTANCVVYYDGKTNIKPPYTPDEIMQKLSEPQK